LEELEQIDQQQKAILIGRKSKVLKNDLEAIIE